MIPVPAIMGSIGWPEMLLILVLVLLFFGPRRLPEIAEAMGKSIRKFKGATQDATREVRREIEDAGSLRQSEAPRDNGGDKGNDKPQGQAQP